MDTEDSDGWSSKNLDQNSVLCVPDVVEEMIYCKQSCCKLLVEALNPVR